MFPKRQTRAGARPPGRVCRAARVALLGAISAVCGTLVDIYGDTHLVTAAGITLAIFPVLLKLVPAAPTRTQPILPDTAAPAGTGTQAAPIAPHAELPDTESRFEAIDHGLVNATDRTTHPLPHPGLPQQRATPLDAAATEGEVDLGTFTPHPVTVRMTVRPTLNLTTDICPIITVEPHLPTADNEST